MAKLEEITRGSAIRGILPDGIVTVSDVRWIGAVAVEVTYKDTAGRLGNRHERRPPESGPVRPPIFFSHCHYALNAGQNGPWNRTSAYSIDFTVPEPVAVPPSGTIELDIINGPFYRNSRTRPRDVTDGLSQTVFPGEADPILCNESPPVGG